MNQMDKKQLLVTGNEEAKTEFKAQSQNTILRCQCNFEKFKT
jgi:hypothetical protein